VSSAKRLTGRPIEKMTCKKPKDVVAAPTDPCVNRAHAGRSSLSENSVTPDTTGSPNLLRELAIETSKLNTTGSTQFECSSYTNIVGA
jgi:hypothetical protein